MLGRRSMAVGAALAAFGVSLHATAQDKAPQPSPAPAAEKAPAPAAPASADETEVRGVLKSLAKALQEGEGKQIRSVIYAATPTEKKMVDAMADMAVEIARLHKAANKAFGEEQARGL